MNGFAVEVASATRAVRRRLDETTDCIERDLPRGLIITDRFLEAYDGRFIPILTQQESTV
jgi:hypothetical protein